MLFIKDGTIYVEGGAAKLAELEFSNVIKWKWTQKIQIDKFPLDILTADFTCVYQWDLPVIYIMLTHYLDLDLIYLHKKNGSIDVYGLKYLEYGLKKFK